MPQRSIMLSDWEGPWVTADHAYAVVSKGIPNGDRVFRQISAYDDKVYWVDKRRGYEPGDTLGLVAPFLIAYWVDEVFLRKVATEEAKYIDGAIPSLMLLDQLGHKPTIVSTSYEQYVRPTAALAGIPPSRVYCTAFPIDKYATEVGETDKKLVREWAERILELPEIDVSTNSTMETLSPGTRQAVSELDRLFWEILPKTSFARVMKEVRPTGGSRKTAAVEEALTKEGLDYRGAVVVGDSITDSDMLSRTAEQGGLAVGFNPNAYGAVKSQLVIMADNCTPTALVVDVHSKYGLAGVRNLAREWRPDMHVHLRSSVIEPQILEALEDAYPEPENNYPKLVWITPENMEQTIAEAKVWRKRVRGVNVGSLG